tara:strand:+ start:194 stop:556 length:363 start_codon:yes stop_codon:yes gene_type:complete
LFLEAIDACILRRNGTLRRGLLRDDLTFTGILYLIYLFLLDCLTGGLLRIFNRNSVAFASCVDAIRRASERLSTFLFLISRRIFAALLSKRLIARLADLTSLGVLGGKVIIFAISSLPSN